MGRITRLPLLLTAILMFAPACVRGGRFEPLDFDAPPAVADWGPHRVAMEWWYVSSVDLEAQRAFHVAFFRAYPPSDMRVLGISALKSMPAPALLAHVAVTDLASDRVVFQERRAMPWESGCVSNPPLAISLRDWRLDEEGEGAFRLRAGAVDVRLGAAKPVVTHPPGYTGSAASGRLFYQSITRLDVEGTVDGRPYRGRAWMDHQWGDQVPGKTALWDWCGLHTNAGLDVMLYRVITPDGDDVHITGTVTDEAGTCRALEGLTIRPTRSWTSPSGRVYRVAWRAEAEGFVLDVEPMRLEQELLTCSTCVAYWEGPVRFRGTWQGEAIQGWGMAESVAGFLSTTAPDAPPGYHR